MTLPTETLLFDWGDTLMVDFPNASGKMCDWERVEAVRGAEETLRYLYKRTKIHIATGAADSSEKQIKAAFNRVGLDSFISGYFCKANLGVGKDSPDFFPRILRILGTDPQQVTMVGDNLQKDIEPAIKCGITGIWFTQEKAVNVPNNVRTITSLRQLSV